MVAVHFSHGAPPPHPTARILNRNNCGKEWIEVMRPKYPLVALATVGLVLILTNSVCTTPADLGFGRIWIVYTPALFVNPVRTTRTTPIDLGTWYTFEWSGFVALDGWLEASGSSYYVWVGFADPGASPWTFTAPPEGVYFTVTDMETDVDSFAIKDDGVLLGTTPDSGPWDSHDPCYWDPQGCMDSDFSHGTFFFGAGEHSITIENKDHRGVTGRGAFRLDAVSEPVDGNEDRDEDGVIPQVD